MNQMPHEVQLAIGRLYSLTLRPSQPGDIAQYEMCRKIIMDAAGSTEPHYEVCWARDRMKGAAGQ